MDALDSHRGDDSITSKHRLPAQVPQIPDSSPGKNTNHQNRKDVGDKLESYEIGVTKFKAILSKKGSIKEKKLEINDENFVSYLNNPSRIICQEDDDGCRGEVPERVTVEEKVVPPSPAVSSKQEQPIKLDWPQLEATAEIFSRGSTASGALSQADAYLYYLLQARPDLISVTGISVHPKDPTKKPTKKSTFQLLFRDAWGGCHTSRVAFDDNASLLVAWVRRLYDPELTPNIQRVGIYPSKPTFTIDAGHRDRFKNCTISFVGSIRRRATIFGAQRGDKPLIIKSQYHDEERRFEESKILNTIHSEGDFPGIVRVLEGGSPVRVPVGRPSGIDVLDKHRSSYKMSQTVLVLKDKEGPLMEVATPLEALIAIYDLLEVTHFLYKTRKILHRDISKGNVLLRNKAQKPGEPSEAFPGMCFATRLLGDLGGNSKADRLYTRVVLIDFHQAEEKVTDSTGHLKDRSGTPRFMARLVRIPIVPQHLFPPLGVYQMPQLTGPASTQYLAHVRERINDFSENTNKTYHIAEAIDIEPKFSHKLSYDAESILWLLLYWAIRIQPDGKPKDGIPEDKIHANLWADLTGGDFKNDTRRNLVPLKWQGLCHPVYQPLDMLLVDLFTHLSGYQEYVVGLEETPSKERDPGRTKPEYLHEVFQRIIFRFIVDNRQGGFMHKPIGRRYRRADTQAAMPQATKTTGLWMGTGMGEKRKTREPENQEGRVEGEAPRKKPKTDDERMEPEGAVARDGPNIRSTVRKSTSNSQPGKERNRRRKGKKSTSTTQLANGEGMVARVRTSSHSNTHSKGKKSTNT